MTTPVYNAKGKDLTISVSSRETWDLCMRKWYYAYFMRLEQPETEALLIGNAVHLLLETRLRDKKWLIEDPLHWHRRLADKALAASGIDPDDHDWVVEKWLDKSTCGPLPLVGKVDLHRVKDGVLQVWDWKTCGGPRFALDEEMLRRHHQPLIYGYALGQEHGVAGQPFDVRYVYVDKKTTDAWPVDAAGVTFADATQRFDAFAVIAEKMAKIATDQPRADAIPANSSACWKYGTLCAFASFCSAAPKARIPDAYQPPGVPLLDPRMLTAMSTAQLSGLAALAAAAGVSSTAAPPAAVAAPPPVRTGPPAVEDPVGACAAQVVALLDVPHFAKGVPEATVSAMAKGMGARLADVIEAAGVVMAEGRFVRPAAPAAAPPKAPSFPPVGTPVDQYTPGQLEAAAAAGHIVRFGLVVNIGDAMLDVGSLYAKYHGANEAVAAVTSIVAAIEGTLPPVAEPAPAEAPPPATEPPAGVKLDTEAEVVMAADWLRKATWRQDTTTVSALREAFLGLLPGRKRLGPTFVAKAVAASGIMHITEDGETIVFDFPEVKAPAAQHSGGRLGAGLTEEPPPQAAPESPAPAVAPADPPPAPEPPAPAAVPASAPALLATVAMLFVNIVVEKGLGPTPFAEWVARLEPQVVEHAKSVGLKGSEYGHYGLIEFGKGTTLMDVAIRGAVKQGLMPAMMALDMSHPLAHVMLAAAHATPGYVVYRGLR